MYCIVCSVYLCMFMLCYLILLDSINVVYIVFMCVCLFCCYVSVYSIYVFVSLCFVSFY